jgi:uroporphyrinogen decarboxylase
VNSRQRVQTALDHREPDRVPLDIGGTETTGIHLVALANWMRFMGLGDGDPEIFSLITQLGRVPEDMLQRLRVDVRCLRTVSPDGREQETIEKGRCRFFEDEWRVRWRMPVDQGLYYDIAASPLSSLSTVEELERFAWPDPALPERYSRLREEALRVDAESSAALVLERAQGGILETATWLRGFENILMDFATDPALACGIMDRVLEFKMTYWERALQEVKARVLVVAEADDLGTQESLLISREMYRTYIKPRHSRLFAHIKRIAPGVKIFYHSCGAVRELIPDLIESGIDILNPIQVSARGMHPGDLKRQFGKNIVFWGGGVDTQRVLPRGTPEQVRDEVHRRIDQLAPGGGFVFAAVHCIQADVPPRNLTAMWEALQEYGRY